MEIIMKTSFLKLVTAVSLGCAIASPALAEGHKYEVSGAVGYNFFDSDRGLDDDAFYGLGFGVVLTPKWTFESWLTTGDTDFDSNTGGDVDIDAYRFDLLYHLPDLGAWTPYAVGGIGQTTYDISGLGSQKETQINFGLGLKRQLSDHWNFRTDFRAIDDIDQSSTIFNDTGTDYALQAAFTYAFGDKPYVAPVAPVGPVDTDGDGVVDSADLCPNTPSGVKVDSRGCPLDTDRDGVYDYLDKCPGTARNLKVDSDGCPLELTETEEIVLAVQFDTNKAIVKSEYFAEIKRVATFMNQYANTQVVVVGHTDSRGSASYNQALSERRAAAVAAVLIREHGIAANRVSSRGEGESSPVASNDTKEGRAQNRRVVGEVSAKIQKFIQK